MDRLDILNTIIKRYNFQSYLEIGVFGGYTFNNILCQHKVGVDPDKNSAANIFLTSDEFFEQNQETFDLIFIDGLHHADQVKKDIENSLKVLNHGGFIVCHDMNPHSEIIQRVPRVTDAWTGDCWKAWVEFRESRDDLKMFVIDTDHGCGIIQRGNQTKITVDCELDWNNFVKNKQYWMNIISTEDFLKDLQ